MNRRSGQPLVPWSWWIWLGHGVFVGALYLYMFTPFKPDWFKMSFSAISLGHEENYAVWWSGICLFIASQLFYRLASECGSLREGWKWAILAMAMLALGYDEIGSLHEMVSKVGGWQALVPFALIFMAGFGGALFALFRQPGNRVSALLVLLGIAVFAAVASLEFVEHNIRLNKHEQRNRLIIEEGAELFAMSLIIIAGLIALRRAGVINRRLSGIVGSITRLNFHPLAVFVLFAIQFAAISLFAIPGAGNFSEGNPASVFPIFLFFTLSMMCFNIARTGQHILPWLGMSAVFMFTSLCQIHSFTVLLHKLEYFVPWFIHPPETWLVTLVPMAGLVALLTATGKTDFRQLAIDLALLGLVFVTLYPDHGLPMTYHLFSGCVALICYRQVAPICYVSASPELEPEMARS